MDKKSIGGIIILGGVAFIGYIWFKRNKPKIAENQLSQLQAQSLNLATSADTIDKPFDYTQPTQNAPVVAPVQGYFEPNYSNLTPKEKEELQIAVNQACPLCANLDFQANLSNQIATNLQNSDLSQLGNYDWSKINFSNIKI